MIYVPSFEKDHWHVINAVDGAIIARSEPKSGAHNTIVGPDGKEAYLAGLRSPLLTVADVRTHTIARTGYATSSGLGPANEEVDRKSLSRHSACCVASRVRTTELLIRGPLVRRRFISPDFVQTLIATAAFAIALIAIR